MEELRADEKGGRSSESEVTKPKTQTAPPVVPSIPRQDNKRKLSDVIRNSPYYKIRAIVRDLRPHFIEVLRTPDFQNCKAAHEIRKQMKLIMDLHKQMNAEAESQSLPWFTKLQEPFSQDNWPGAGKAAEKRATHSSLEKQPVNTLTHRSYIVGGSAFGWNFITFAGNKPVYYGVTKEFYRRCHPKARTANLPPVSDISTENCAPVIT